MHLPRTDGWRPWAVQTLSGIGAVSVILGTIGCRSKPERVHMETDFGVIVIETMPDTAPEHTNNFVKLARAGFYDSTTFHRVIPGFMIQGGDPNSKDDNPHNDGQGGPGYTLPAEIKAPHYRGSVAAARLGDAMNPQRRSSGSQFYICVVPTPHLDGQYTVFGRVVEGMDVVDQIVSVPQTGPPSNRPLSPRLDSPPR